MSWLYYTRSVMKSQAIYNKSLLHCYNLVDMTKIPWSEWITQKFLDWRKRDPLNNRTIAQFGLLFNASQPVMSDWMKKDGKIPTSHKHISALIDYFGVEVCEVLEIPVPESIMFLYSLPEPLREAFFEARNEYTMELLNKEISPDSPEAKEIIKVAFEKRGVKFNVR